MRADETNFGARFLRLMASATLQSFFNDGVEVLMMTWSKSFAMRRHFLHADIVRRAVEQAGIRRERGGLREPGGIPIAGDFAPRLITRTRAAVKPVKAGW